MSKGLGTVQKKIIAYLEEHNGSPPKYICEAIPDHDRATVYGAIKSLKSEKRKILIDGGSRSLWIGERHPSQIGKSVMLNEESEDYKQYKARCRT